MDKISVIIRARNEERWIGYCIQSVIDNLFKPEIIIINDNSNDETLKICRLFLEAKVNNNRNSGKIKNYTSIKILDIKDYTPGKAINLGIKNSKNNLIMCLSSHCVIKKLDFLKIKIQLKKYPAIFGNQVPIYLGKKILKRYLWQNFKSKKVVNMYSDQEKRYFFHNAASIFQKNLLKKFPFNETLSGKEDRYWASEIVRKGYNFLYDPINFEVEHHYTENGNTWKGMS